MLFARQRLLLTLLDTLREPVGHTDFQKLLFLFTQEFESTPTYEFVPYRFGCYSFTACADKQKLMTAGLLKPDETRWEISEQGRTLARKSAVTPLVVARFCRKYDGLRGDALIAEVYRRFPFYAVESRIIERVLPDPTERDRIHKARPSASGPALLTIGYEGKSLEAYLNTLLRAGVTLLCDVRRNPLSRKYGFSKSTLRKACEKVGIRYEHIPELGIDSELRKELVTQADYDNLFEVYERESLPHMDEALARIRSWIEDEGARVALTCFEKFPHQCHRHCISEALEPKLAFPKGTLHL
jgi:hypothetical protein